MRKKSIIVCLAITICWVALSLALYVIAKGHDGQLFLMNFSGHHLRLGAIFFVLVVMAAGWAVYGLAKAWRHAKRILTKTAVVLGYIVTAAAVLILGLVSIGDRAVTTYHEFESPDGKYQLTLAESSFLLASRVEVYERTSPFLIRDLAYLMVDDGGTPVSNGNYTLDWNENEAVIAVDAYTHGIWSAARITFSEEGSHATPYKFYSDSGELVE